MREGVSIIIPNYNGRDLLEKNIPYVIGALKNKDNHIAEVIVVDDASKDGSVEYLKDNFPEISIIKHRINRGFSTSVNTGARMAKGKLLVLLNNDVTPAENFLKSTIRLFDNSNLFAVSLHEKGYGYAVGKFENGFIVHEPAGEDKGVHETFWASGGSAVFKRSLWMKLGGFDSKLYSPYYWEDLDISYRARKRGYSILWNSESNVVHEHESTTIKFSKRKRARVQERNQLIFIWKNLTSKFLFRKHIVGLGRRVVKHPGYLIIVVMALTKVKLLMKARQKERKESKVSDEAIFAGFSSQGK
jgi:GT2 family glycosyltransferase